MKTAILALGFALLTCCPLLADTPVRLFASGFEGNITLAPKGGDYRTIEGTDIKTGYSWPIDILGATGSALHPIDHDNHRAVQNEIQTVTGHNGHPTRALFSIQNYNTLYTQSPYEILNIKQGRRDLYVRFWIKLDRASLTQPDMWRTYFEWKTKGYARGAGFRLISYIYTDANGQPYWHWQGDRDPEHPLWEIDNHDVPVPRGKWFLNEFYWHWSEAANGRALWKVNGQVIGDHHGPTTRNHQPIDFIMLAQIYGNANPKHQWVDDVEIWSGWPD